MFRKKRRRSLQYKNESIIINSHEARNERKVKRDERQEMPEYEGGKNPKKKNKLRLFYVISILAMIIIMLVAAFSVVSQQKEHNTALEEQQALEEEKKNLEYELKQVDTLEYVEEQARRILKMIKPGEILYVIPERKDSVD